MPNTGMQTDSGFTTPQPARLDSNRSGLPASLAHPAAAAEAECWVLWSVYVKEFAPCSHL